MKRLVQIMIAFVILSSMMGQAYATPSNGLIELDSRTMDGLTAFTIGLWINTSDTGFARSILSGENASLNNEILIRHDDSGNILDLSQTPQDTLSAQLG